MLYHVNNIIIGCNVVASVHGRYLVDGLKTANFINVNGLRKRLVQGVMSIRC